MSTENSLIPPTGKCLREMYELLSLYENLYPHDTNDLWLIDLVKEDIGRSTDDISYNELTNVIDSKIFCFF